MDSIDKWNARQCLLLALCGEGKPAWRAARQELRKIIAEHREELRRLPAPGRFSALSPVLADAVKDWCRQRHLDCPWMYDVVAATLVSGDAHSLAFAPGPDLEDFSPPEPPPELLRPSPWAGSFPAYKAREEYRLRKLEGWARDNGLVTRRAPRCNLAQAAEWLARFQYGETLTSIAAGHPVRDDAIDPKAAQKAAVWRAMEVVARLTGVRPRPAPGQLAEG